jgi:hypothetical protein
MLQVNINLVRIPITWPYIQERGIVTQAGTPNGRPVPFDLAAAVDQYY